MQVYEKLPFSYKKKGGHANLNHRSSLNKISTATNMYSFTYQI
jgi:hypothetical protein